MEPSTFRWSCAVYRRLLAVLPADFRGRFGDDMTEDFREMLAPRAAGRPVRGRLACWRRALADLLATRRDQRLARRSPRVIVPERRWPVPALLMDLRYAARALARTPGYVAVTVVILALGIGANTAIFSLVDAALFRPLPVADPDRLVAIYEGIPQVGLPKIGASAPDVLDFEAMQRSFDGLAAFRNREVELSGRGESERVMSARISASLLPLLGVGPAVGRNFTPAEDQPGAAVAIISYGLWQRRFGGAADVLGRKIIVDREPLEIVGVMPAFFRFPLRGPLENNEPADLFVPMAFTPFERQARGMMFNLSLLGRLKPGVTLAAARTEFGLIAPRVEANYPPEIRATGFHLAFTLSPFRDDLTGDARRPLLVLLGAVGLVLLVACANVANLVLSRAAGRAREMGLRVALGASRRRLLQVLVAESAILAGLGGGLGLLLARWSLGAARSFLPANLPGAGDVGLDARVLAFTVGLSLATALVFGFAPLVTTRATQISETLREGGGRTTAGRRRQRVQAGLVVSTVALAVVLLVGAGLLMRSFARLTATDAGFDPNGVLTMSLVLPPQAYDKADRVRAFVAEVHDAMAALPGVATASLSTALPLAGNEHRAFTAEGSDTAPTSTAATWVDGDYFTTFGIHVVRGRPLGAGDSQDAQRVAVVNEALARRYWRGQDPIGKRIKWGIPASQMPWMTVVGVVADVHDASLAAEPAMHVYVPYDQAADAAIEDRVTNFYRTLSVAFRTVSDPAALAPAALGAIRRLDPSLPVTDVRTMRERVSASVAAQRLMASLLAGFAIVALLLAAVGLYGVLALAVAQRRAEIGVRMALGAPRGQVVGLIVKRGMRLTAAGLALGLVAAVGAARLLSSLLYRTTPGDLPTFLAVPLVLALVALAATALPALRASRIDPIQALRSE